jgi:Ca2+/Na+ antiporter
LLGFLAICLAGYVLSHAATTITDEFGISDVLFGIVVLAIATTLPEKFVAVMSGHRGHAGILVANTAGSNIFLLALCSGIVMLDTSGKLERGNVNVAELGVLWGSTVAFTATVWFDGRFCRRIGFGMLIAYVTFIVLEFTLIHGVANGD